MRARALGGRSQLRVEDVALVEREVRVVGELGARERVPVQVVDRDDLVLLDEPARERRRDEARASGDEDRASLGEPRGKPSGCASSIAARAEDRPLRRRRPPSAARDPAREGARAAGRRRRPQPGRARACRRPTSRRWSTSRTPAAVLTAVRRLRIDGVLTVSADRAVPVVAAVAEALGLPGIGVETAHLMTHKVAMRREARRRRRAAAAVRGAADARRAAARGRRGRASRPC